MRLLFFAVLNHVSCQQDVPESQRRHVVVIKRTHGVRGFDAHTEVVSLLRERLGAEAVKEFDGKITQADARDLFNGAALVTLPFALVD